MSARDARRRREAVARILRGEPVGTQEELLAALVREGFRVTQATLSRDLARLSARRVSRPEGSFYEIGDGAPTAVAAAVSGLVAGVATNGSLVVIRTLPGSAPAVARAIEEVLDLHPRMSALDVGGGTGRLSILLADRVGSAVVTDPSAGMVQVARERIEEAGLSDRLRAVQADLTTDRLDGSYDVAWSSMALHHVRDLDGLLRSVAGLLVDGGRLAIADLDEDPDGAFHADKADFDGHHGFVREHLTEQLARAGFADVSFVDAATILKGDREFGVFLCTATKGASHASDH